MGGMEQLKEKATCAKDRMVTRAHNAMVTKGAYTYETANNRLALCGKDDRTRS